MTITMETALYLYSILGLIGFVLISLLAIGYRGKKTYAEHFMLYFFLLIITPILIIFRAVIPQFLSVIVANMIIVIAYLSLYIGVNKLIERKPNTTFISIISFATISLFLVFTYVYSDVRIRIVSMNIIMIAIFKKQLLMFNLQKENGPLLMNSCQLFCLLWRSSWF